MPLTIHLADDPHDAPHPTVVKLAKALDRQIMSDAPTLENVLADVMLERRCPGCGNPDRTPSRTMRVWRETICLACSKMLGSTHPMVRGRIEREVSEAGQRQLGARS